jgi:translocation and assembly module TamA
VTDGDRRKFGVRVLLLALLLLALLLALLLGSLAVRAAAAQGEGAATEVGEPQSDSESSTADATPGIAYSVEITGDPEPELKDLLIESSQLFALQDQPPATLAALRRRAEGDLERLEQTLRSEGFYASALEQRIDTDSDPVKVTIAVATGPLYLLEDYQVNYEDAPPRPDPAANLAALGIEIGMAARAPAIVEAQRRLLRELGNNGYPLAEVGERRAVVDHAASTMTVELRLAAGPRSSFGPTVIEGLSEVQEDYVRTLLPWQDGDLYDQRQVETARLALSQSDLFSTIRIEHAEAADADGTLPMTVQLAEREHRTLGAGASFSTGEGPGGQVYWEHRNLFGSNERLRFSVSASLIERSVEANFRKPHYLHLDQALLAESELAQRSTDAFDEDSARAFVGLDRKLDETWSVSGGGAIEFAELTETDLESSTGEEQTRSFRLYSTPLGITRDTSNSLLNPTEGTKLNLALTPYFGTLEELGSFDESVVFLASELSGSAYLALDAEERIVLAARGRLGSIVGASTAALPASKRFYSGGGGSVRGYEFQSIGPEDLNGDPTGGRSVMEVGGEARIRITEDIGIVPFIEGGIIGDQPFVDFEEQFLWAAGLGLRYYTAVGPLRLDVAFPINGREQDDFFQFYVSLGQAF